MDVNIFMPYHNLYDILSVPNKQASDIYEDNHKKKKYLFIRYILYMLTFGYRRCPVYYERTAELVAIFAYRCIMHIVCVQITIKTFPPISCISISNSINAVYKAQAAGIFD